MSSGLPQAFSGVRPIYVVERLLWGLKSEKQIGSFQLFAFHDPFSRGKMHDHFIKKKIETLFSET